VRLGLVLLVLLLLLLLLLSLTRSSLLLQGSPENVCCSRKQLCCIWKHRQDPQGRT
jgi:hypothetical protein